MPLPVLLPLAVSALIAQPLPSYPLRSTAPRGVASMNDKGGALARAGALDSSLEQALSSLPMKEKYNAVLESLISRRGPGSEASIFELIEEMTGKRIRLSDTAVKALVDYGVQTTNAQLVLKALSAGRENGALRTFATPQAKISARPDASALSVLPAVPTDDRIVEISAAGAFLVVAAGVLLAEVADFVDFILPGDFGAPPAQLILVGLAAGWGYDRYTQQGSIAGTVTRGLSRLLERDLQRECAAESASFLVGYLLGLPCLAFSPTAYKPLEMVASSAESITPLISGPSRLLDRTLVWLMAPVAAETLDYRETLQSDPTLSLKLLQVARRRVATLGIDPDEGGWNAEDDEARVKWALAEARALLKRYSGVREQLQERMVTGVSAGECVVLIEERLKNQWGSI